MKEIDWANLSFGCNTEASITALPFFSVILYPLFNKFSGDASVLQPGDELTTRFAKGEIKSKVTKK